MSEPILITKTFAFGWFGRGFETECVDFPLYKDDDDASLVTGLENVAIISQSSGTIKQSWSAYNDNERRTMWETGKVIYEASGKVKKEFIPQSQSLTKLQCGHAYIIELKSGGSFSIPHFQPSYYKEGGTNYVISLTDQSCPDIPECDCKSTVFSFNQILNNKFTGYESEDLLIKCEEYKSGLITPTQTLYRTTDGLDVGTELYLDERTTAERDIFDVDDQWIYSRRVFYRIVGRKIVEIVPCGSIKGFDFYFKKILKKDNEYKGWWTADLYEVCATIAEGEVPGPKRTLIMDTSYIKVGTKLYIGTQSDDDLFGISQDDQWVWSSLLKKFCRIEGRKIIQIEDCPRDCVSQWGDWTHCFNEDAPGEAVECTKAFPADGVERPTRIQTLQIITRNNALGIPCPTKTVNVEDCIAQSEADTIENVPGDYHVIPDCPEPCVEGDWQSWDEIPCSEDCGVGLKKRIKSIISIAKFGAPDCPSEEERTEYQFCNTRPCKCSDAHICVSGVEQDEYNDIYFFAGPFADREYWEGYYNKRLIVWETEFVDHTGVELTPGEPPVFTGQDKGRWIGVENLGDSREGSPLVSVLTDYTKCPTDVEWVTTATNIPKVFSCSPTPCDTSDWLQDENTDWEGWGPCINDSEVITDCGGGTQTRTKEIITEPYGTECPDLVETKKCAEESCNTPPTATDACILPSKLSILSVPSANYTYFDQENDPEVGSEIRWYRVPGEYKALEVQVNEGYIYLSADGSLWGLNPFSYLNSGEPTARTRQPISASLVGTEPFALGAGFGGTYGNGENSGVSMFSLGASALIYVKDGELLGNGENYYGQLAGSYYELHGSLHATYGPVSMGVSNPRVISAGTSHNAIITEDGELWTVGDNSSGQLGGDGDGNTPDRVRSSSSGPVTIAKGTPRSRTWVEVEDPIGTVGDLGDWKPYHTEIPWDAPLTMDLVTKIYQIWRPNHTTEEIWRDPGVEYWFTHATLVSELVLAFSGSAEAKAQGIQFAGPTIVDAGTISDAVDVSAGHNHTMFVRENGTLWGFGANEYGQLGSGTTEYVLGGRQTPDRCKLDAHGDLVKDVVSVECGTGVTFFIKKDGSLWGMGFAQYGRTDYINNLKFHGHGFGSANSSHLLTHSGGAQLGKSYIDRPVMIDDGKGLGGKVVSCNPGLFLSNVASFIKEDGSLWVWGNNRWLSLGWHGSVETANTSGVLAKESDIFYADPIKFPSKDASYTPTVMSMDFTSLMDGKMVYADIYGDLWHVGGIGPGNKCTGTAQRVYQVEHLLVPELDDKKTHPDNTYTKFGDTWYYTIKPSDGKEFGEMVTSCAKVINNIPPSTDPVIRLHRQLKQPEPCVWEWTISENNGWDVCRDLSNVATNCGEATQKRTKKIISQGKYGGELCDVDDLVESRPCDFGPCPIPCEWHWDDFGPCTGCGGYKTRTRIITQEAVGTTPCPDPDYISTQPCMRDCAGGTALIMSEGTANYNDSIAEFWFHKYTENSIDGPAPCPKTRPDGEHGYVEDDMCKIGLGFDRNYYHSCCANEWPNPVKGDWGLSSGKGLRGVGGSGPEWWPKSDKVTTEIGRRNPCDWYNYDNPYVGYDGFPTEPGDGDSCDSWGSGGTGPNTSAAISAKGVIYISQEINARHMYVNHWKGRNKAWPILKLTPDPSDPQRSLFHSGPGIFAMKYTSEEIGTLNPDHWISNPGEFGTDGIYGKTAITTDLDENLYVVDGSQEGNYYSTNPNLVSQRNYGTRFGRVWFFPQGQTEGNVTLASGLDSARRICVDRHKNIYILDIGSQNSVLKKLRSNHGNNKIGVFGIYFMKYRGAANTSPTSLVDYEPMKRLNIFMDHPQAPSRDEAGLMEDDWPLVDVSVDLNGNVYVSYRGPRPGPSYIWSRSTPKVSWIRKYLATDYKVQEHDYEGRGQVSRDNAPPLHGEAPYTDLTPYTEHKGETGQGSYRSSPYRQGHSIRGIGVDGGGDLYVQEHWEIFRIRNTTGDLDTLSGYESPVLFAHSTNPKILSVPPVNSKAPYMDIPAYVEYYLPGNGKPAGVSNDELYEISKNKYGANGEKIDPEHLKE